MLKKSTHFLLLFFLVSLKAFAQSEAEEYSLKAAFIYNFTQYIDWDVSNNKNKDEFIVAVIGASPIIKPLEAIARTKNIKGKKIIIRNYLQAEDIRFCDILFISRQCSLPLNTILMNASSKGTLIISEEEEYAKYGVAINFVIIDSKLKFESNIRALDAAGLKASSQLLKLAVAVYSH